jgi:hypothetical protein
MSAIDDGWQRALAAEEQAVFGYALLGPQLAATATSFARTCQAAHEHLRDTTEAARVAAGVSPSPPPADYPSLYPVSDSSAAERLAIRLEQDAASAWRFAYAVAAETTGAAADELRTAAQAALTASAVRATRWRLASGALSPTVAFPGI